MDLPELKSIYEHREIPAAFYSSETGQPFSRCMSCDRYLLQDGVQYVIEKAVRQYQKFNTTDTIFEYAMCLACYDQVQQTFSETSKSNVDNYFRKNVDMIDRRESLLKAGDIDVEPWISNCLLKGTPKKELSEYQIVCQCDGRDMLFTFSPFLISGEAIDELVQLLSNKTLDELDGLNRELLGPPPELQSILDDRRLLVL